MSTTMLFAELLIVGLQAVVWMALLVGAFVGPQGFRWVACVFRNAGVPTTIGVMAIGYVAGVILDEFYESLIDPWAKHLRDGCRENGIPEMWAVQAHVFVKSTTGTSQLEYMRSRIWIVRSSIFNFFLIAVFSLVYLGIQVDSSEAWRTGAIIFTAIAGLLSVPISIFVYSRLVKSYWGRAKNLWKALH